MSLEAGGKNEQIGVVIECGETFGRYGAKGCDSAGKLVSGYADIEPCRFIRIAREVSGNRQPPRKLSQCGQRGNEYVKSFPGHNSANGQQMRHFASASPRPRRRIAAGPCHTDALGRYAKIGSDK